MKTQGPQMCTGGGRGGSQGVREGGLPGATPCAAARHPCQPLLLVLTNAVCSSQTELQIPHVPGLVELTVVMLPSIGAAASEEYLPTLVGTVTCLTTMATTTTTTVIETMHRKNATPGQLQRKL